MQLLRDLDEAGERQKIAARTALASSPKLASLLAARETFPVTGSTTDCLAQVEPRCLLAEALSAATATEPAKARDWVWLDLAEARLALGDGENSLLLISRLDDPRLVTVLVAAYALDLAAGGDPDTALTWIDAIPDPHKRMETLVALADAAFRRGERSGGLVALKGLHGYLDALPNVELGLAPWLSWRAATGRIAARIGEPVPERERPEVLRALLPGDPSPALITDLARLFALLGDLTSAEALAKPLGIYRVNAIGTAIAGDLALLGRYAEANKIAAVLPEVQAVKGAQLRVRLAELKNGGSSAAFQEAADLVLAVSPGAREAWGPELALKAAEVGEWEIAERLLNSFRDALGRMATAWRLSLIAPTPERAAHFRAMADQAADSLPEGGLRVATLARIARAALDAGVTPATLSPLWTQARQVAAGVLSPGPRARAFGQLALLVNLISKRPGGTDILK
ncbi:hypothetical protein ACFSM5_11710 [Lacibacterium aquatile]|uniref:Uncharacterized protein n=1 Tax=Lacibacterium aquatile TaxID=1168082 RepID=A0ABW5DR02_9PROT